MPNLLDGKVNVSRSPASDRAPGSAGDDVTARYATKNVEAIISQLAGLPKSQQLAVMKELEGLTAQIGVIGSGDKPFERLDAVKAGLSTNLMGGRGSAEIIQGRQGPPSLNFNYSRQFKSGGQVARGDGIAKRGKTKGKMVHP
jgi:hypothetical protein